ncbi:hypothetical protein FRC19_008327 [Serendipita sp. 401]|nr:hypothetical protein FRC19_008327 [Serendipita sp. 401]KAG9058706.1 hypothetical protein FS842_003495 [Serendipita sp. 407]
MIGLRLDGFFPALGVPIESAPAATLAFLFLWLAILSLTFKPTPFVKFTRLLLCAISIHWFWQFGFGYVAPTRLVESGVAIICGYGTLRNIETGLGYLVEPIPQWVKNGETQEIPTILVWRLIWSLDLLFSMRGTSYLPGVHWNFATKAIIDQKHVKSRSRFIFEGLFSMSGLAAQLLLVDVFDTTIKARVWPTLPATSQPITSLPLSYQLYYSTVVCMMTALAISVPYTALSVIAVMFGSRPESWPPEFDDPFTAVSLQDFWTHRWHASFRRVLLMNSAMLVDATKPVVNRRRLAALRGLCIFSFSCLLHLVLVYRIRPVGSNKEDISFLDTDVFIFFLLQPLGMFLEVAIVRPAAKTLSAKRAPWITRLWAWAWLLWTGRYWSNVWVKHGLWDPRERVVGYSLIRGYLYGQWRQ